MAHLFHSLFSLSISLSLFQSPSFSHPLTPPYIYLSYPPHLSLSHSPFSLSFSLFASFPPFLSFHLRLFNPFNDHSPSPFSPPFTPLPPDYNRCTNLLCFLCTERTVLRVFTYLPLTCGFYQWGIFP